MENRVRRPSMVPFIPEIPESEKVNSKRTSITTQDQQSSDLYKRTFLTLTESAQLSAFLVRKLSKAFFNSQNGGKIGWFKKIFSCGWWVKCNVINKYFCKYGNRLRSFRCEKALRISILRSSFFERLCNQLSYLIANFSIV